MYGFAPSGDAPNDGDGVNGTERSDDGEAGGTPTLDEPILPIPDVPMLPTPEDPMLPTPDVPEELEPLPAPADGAGVKMLGGGTAGDVPNDGAEPSPLPGNAGVGGLKIELGTPETVPAGMELPGWHGLDICGVVGLTVVPAEVCRPGDAGTPAAV